MRALQTPKTYYSTKDCDLDEFSLFCSASTSAEHYPLASQVISNVLVYQGDDIRKNLSEVRDYQAEFAHALLTGPGVFVIKNFYDDTSVIDKMSEVFEQILKSESGFGAGDHFGETGELANGRIWNVFQKSADVSPDSFIHYYKNPLLLAVSEAWLGPHFQLTAQVNIVRPGGKAQVSHRDYHLGFQQPEETSRYPIHIQQMSAMLTLQGAVAHTDMPLESGPTKLLPFSHLYPLGYVAYHQKAFQAYFDAHCVQVPLEKGDAVFFNPALFHAAGENRTTDFHRCANLLQVSSAFAKPMETVDLAHICRVLYPSLLTMWHSGQVSKEEKHAIATASSDGYSFPTNLDTDPPIGGLAPETMEALLIRALDEKLDPASFEIALAQLKEKQRT
ncbi:phytanoyl-CoA dioxygenase family protein [Enterovibrio sp. ZSDZ35]|uniref:Phytanoyl-CoA dioxygenase family protein n=1 Tax=Enterovibrio qingdaonensis TaxID=2899818 RepID=A0ABT5QQX2_9GAMM|nr:phytanoyl-CoA dioxygenase family protein [Enterovibrio sp. ZSDZ35]MDD1783383.1 phytanoyl-CoA dioxygenase family protein [Enterovibrio sp. ZSDZ35]